MTVESLVYRATQYVSWLYQEREWARWELLTVALTVLVLLLLIVRLRRKAKAASAGVGATEETTGRPETVGVRLAAGKGDQQRFEDFKSHRIASISSKNDGQQKQWKETTKKWKSFQKLIEQLQHEITKYKQAEESFEQQFAKLKAANERLGHEIAESKQGVEHSEPSRSRTAGGFGKQQGRTLDASEVLAENS
jgi:peptidoglycan hydrolase CwlO-like protein